MYQSKPTYIYESPDGGKTVYARPFGADPADRFIVSNGDTSYQKEQTSIQNFQLAIGMFELARSNESLREALDHAIMIYNLIKNDHGSIKHTK